MACLPKFGALFRRGGCQISLAAKLSGQFAKDLGLFCHASLSAVKLQ